MLALVAIAHPADRSTSRLWRNLRKGTPQTLVIWGTSLCLSRYSYWPDLLKPALAPYGDTSLLSIVNVSQSLGNSSPAALQFIDSVVDMKADAVILEFASSDAVNRLDCTVERCSGPSHDSIVAALQARSPGTDIFLYVTAPPWDKEDCGTTPCRYCSVVYAQRCRRSARASSTDTVEQYYDMVRRLADRRRTHLVDTYGPFRAIYDTAFASYGEWIYDGIHPSVSAASEIIVPAMIDAFRGKPLALTSPVAGDTLRAGEPLLLRWAYDPDSVNLITFDISLPRTDYWVPLLTQSMRPDPCSLWLVCPWQVQGDSILGDSVYLRVSQYNSSTIFDDMGPVVVAASSAANGTAVPRRSAAGAQWRVGWSGVYTGLDLAGARVCDFHGRRLSDKKAHRSGLVLVIEKQ